MKNEHEEFTIAIKTDLLNIVNDLELPDVFSVDTEVIYSMKEESCPIDKIKYRVETTKKIVTVKWSTKIPLEPVE